MRLASYITLKRIAFAQGIYYLATAIWPFISGSSFQDLLGPKRDWWLVLTFSMLMAAIGLAMLTSLKINADLRVARLFGLFIALMLALSEIWFVSSGAIRNTYLIDTFFQALFILGWLATFNWKPNDKSKQ